MPRFPRPLVDAIFISAPDRFEIGPDDHFEVGKVYQMRKTSLERWIGLGRARAATPEEVAAATGAPVAAEPPPPPPPPPPVEPPAPTTEAPKPQDPDDPALSVKDGTLSPNEARAKVGLPPMDAAAKASELLAALAADPRMNFMAFSSKAREILGDDIPAKKVDIVAALKALAEPAAETA